jgi:hypothetical protein
MCTEMLVQVRWLYTVLALSLLACRHEGDLATPAEAPCDTTDVTYSGTIAPLMQTRCALPDCHVSGGDGTGDFTTYEGVLSQVSDGDLVASVQQTSGSIPMPPDSPPIPACEIAAIIAWVNSGAPEN